MTRAAAYLLQEIQLRGASSPLLIAIDGRCAAGKTTLAAELQGETGCNVVHMDDFFLRPEQRTAQRLAQSGGNVDWERFQAEVLIPLRQGISFSYRPYDCRTQALKEAVQVSPRAVTLVEGSYSCHPQLWNYYGLRLFLTVDPQEQLRRIRLRSGPEALEVFRTRWIPLEEQYFRAFSIPERCDARFSTDGMGQAPHQQSPTTAAGRLRRPMALFIAWPRRPCPTAMSRRTRRSHIFCAAPSPADFPESWRCALSQGFHRLAPIGPLAIKNRTGTRLRQVPVHCCASNAVGRISSGPRPGPGCRLRQAWPPPSGPPPGRPSGSPHWGWT